MSRTPNPPAMRARRIHGERIVAKWNCTRIVSLRTNYDVTAAYLDGMVSPPLDLRAGVDQGLNPGGIYVRSDLSC